MKLLAHAARAEELEASDNPFAWYVLAHLKALETKRDDESRYSWKLRLVRNLFERGLTADEIRRLFRLIDWVLMLPEGLVQRFQDDLSVIEEKEKMPYVTSIERLGIKKGREEGREEGIEHGLKTGLRIGIQAVLEARFGEAGRSLAPEIDAVDDRALLEKILDRANKVAALENLRECWR